MPIKYIDSHLHLQDKVIISRAADIIRKSQKAGLGQMFCNATNKRDWFAVIRLAERYGSIYPFLGIHPWFVDSFSLSGLDDLESLLVDSGAGIGEIGLDKTRADFKLQNDVFRKQLKLAVNLHRPVAIHCVRSWGGLLRSMADFDLSSFKFMVHGFSGSLEIMKQLVKMGGFISFSSMLAHPAREKLRQVFIQTPLENILLETDTPNQFYSIESNGSGRHGKPGGEKLNTPLEVIKLYEYAARLRGMNIKSFTGAVWDNGTFFTN